MQDNSIEYVVGVYWISIAEAMNTLVENPEVYYFNFKNETEAILFYNNAKTMGVDLTYTEGTLFVPITSIRQLSLFTRVVEMPKDTEVTSV
jgi:hypothetical protein